MPKTASDSTLDSSALLEETWSRAELLRQRLARRLHDDVCGQLIGSLMDLTLIRNQLPAALGELSSKLQRSCDVLSAAVRANRELVEELRPSLLDNVGLFAALKWHVVETCKSAGIPCSPRLPVDEPSMQSDVALDLFRLAEEALQVVMSERKQIERIDVHGSRSGSGITVTIASSGERVPQANQELPNTLRMQLMAIRASLADALCELSYPTDGGTSITISTGPLLKSVKE